MERSADDKIPGYAPDTDRELFRLIAGGDETSFRVIFQRYGPILQPFAFGIVRSEAIAREIVQETFLRLWLKRETLAEIERPASWLYRVASNLALSHFRRRRIESKVLAHVGSGRSAYDDHGDPPSLRLKELQELIRQAASQLSPLRSKIFHMSRELGLSRKEIAGELGISENTVKNQLGIALKSMQTFIEQHTGTYIPVLLLLSLSAC